MNNFFRLIIVIVCVAPNFMNGQKTYCVLDVDTTISKYLYQVKLQEIGHVDTLTVLSHKGGYRYDICDDYLELGRVFVLELVEVDPNRFFILDRQALKVWSKGMWLLFFDKLKLEF